MRTFLKKILLCCISLLLVLNLFSCSFKENIQTKEIHNSSDDIKEGEIIKIQQSNLLPDNNKTEKVMDTKTTSKSLLKTGSEDVIGLAYSTSSYAIEPTFENLYKEADYVLLVKAEGVDEVRLLEKHDPFPYTFIKLNVLESFKTNHPEPTVSVGFSGGSIPLNEYIEIYGIKEAEMKTIGSLSVEERKNKTISMYPYEIVDIEEDGEYLLFLAYDDKHNCIKQMCDGYSVYVSDGKGGFYNSLQDRVITIDDVKNIG